MAKVIVQLWEKAGDKWSDGEPDGFSLHLTEADRQAFVADYWARAPRPVPEEYSVPAAARSAASIVVYEADVGDVIFEGVRISKNGVRDYDDRRLPAMLLADEPDMLF